jgi:hypothetical protein
VATTRAAMTVESLLADLPDDRRQEFTRVLPMERWIAIARAAYKRK